MYYLIPQARACGFFSKNDSQQRDQPKNKRFARFLERKFGIITSCRKKNARAMSKAQNCRFL